VQQRGREAEQRQHDRHPAVDGQILADPAQEAEPVIFLLLEDMQVGQQALAREDREGGEQRQRRQIGDPLGHRLSRNSFSRCST
jgi:hypothetical protein